MQQSIMQKFHHYARQCMASNIQLKNARNFLTTSSKQNNNLNFLSCTPILKHNSKQPNTHTQHRIVAPGAFPKKGLPHLCFISRHMSQAPWQHPGRLVLKPSEVATKPKQLPVSVEEVIDKTILDLLDADSAQGVLDVYKQWEDKFTEVHSARALWHISEFCGRDQNQHLNNVPANVAGKEIIQMTSFKKLCYRAMRDSANMDDNAFIYSLEALCRLHIPESSTLIQTLLEQSKHRLNTFSCYNLSYFACVLDRIPTSNPLVSSLLDGIALKFPEVLDDTTNMIEVSRFMRAIGKRLPPDQQMKLVHRWYAIMSVRPDVSVSDVIIGLKSLVGMKGQTQLCCQLSVEYLKENISTVKWQDLVSAMISFSQLYCFYSEEFCDIVGNRVADYLSDPASFTSVLSTNQLAHLCRMYTKCTHLHPRLLDAISNSVTVLNQQYTLCDLTFILQPFAELGYLPSNSEQFLDFIINACELADLDKEKLWVSVALATYLVLCGRYPSKMLEYIVQQLAQVTLTEGKDSIMVSNLRKLHQFLSINQSQDMPQLRELQHLIDSLPVTFGQARLSQKQNTMHQQAYMTTKHVLDSLKAEEEWSVLENVKAGLGFTIDFIVDKGESRQAIILRDASCFVVNKPYHPCVSTMMMQQHLEANRYQVVWVLVEMLVELSTEEEWKDYLKTRLIVWNGRAI